MKILITGASGFIGGFLVEEALRRGYETWAGVSIHAPTRGATVCKVTYYKSIN